MEEQWWGFDLLVIVSCYGCCAMCVIDENVDDEQCYQCKKKITLNRKSDVCVEKITCMKNLCVWLLRT